MNTWQFDAKETLAKGFARLMRAAVENAAREFSRTGDELDAGVHEGRKWLKKARALLKLCRFAMEKEQYRAWNRKLRDAGRAVSALRDDAALCETAARLLARDDLSPTARRTLEALRDGIAGDDRDEARKCAALAVRRLKRLRSETNFSIRIREYGEPEVLLRGVSRSWKAARKGGLAFARKRDTETAHEWRKRAKDLRYQMELLVGIWPGPLTAFAEELHRLTDLLGREHDLSSLAAMTPGRAVSRIIAAERAAALSDAISLGARMVGVKPRTAAVLIVDWYVLADADANSRKAADHG